MEMLELKTQSGSTEQVQLEINNYLNNGGMYIGIIAVSEIGRASCRERV